MSARATKLKLALVAITCQFCTLTHAATGVADIQEVRLERSINPISGSEIVMVTKIWENRNDATSHFSFRFYSKASQTAGKGDYLEEVLPFVAGKRQKFSIWISPDCSVEQTAVFRVTTDRAPRLVVVTADRIEASKPEIPIQSVPRAQRLRLYVLKTNSSEEPGKSSLWFDGVRQKITDDKLCTAESVRRVMARFAAQTAETTMLP